jgi:replicative DNA helicase
MSLVLPHSIDGERGVLSSILQNPAGLITDCAASLPVEAFTQEAHQAVYRSILALFASGKPVDPVFLAESLKSHSLLERVGGHAALSELFTFTAAATQYGHFKRLVSDKFNARRHIEAHTKSIEAFMDSTQEFADAVDTAKAHMEGVESTRGRRLNRMSIKDAIGLTINEIEERQQRGGALIGFPTGFPTINERCGGLQKGRVTVFAGLPSDGKSAIMQNCARYALHAGAKVGWYSLEMPITEQTTRILCEDSGVDNASLYNGLMSRGQQEMLQRSIRQLSALGADMIDTDTASAEDIIADIEHGGYDVAVVDYLQLMESEGRKGASREELIAGISRKLKSVAKRTGCHILTASQLNDAGRLRESRAIGHDADCVFMVNKWANKDGSFDDERRKLNCDKNRGGKRQWEIDLLFNGPTFTFREAPKDEE